VTSSSGQLVSAFNSKQKFALGLVMLVILAMPTFVLIPGDAVFELTDFPNYYAASNLIWSARGADIYKHDLVIASEDRLFPRVPKGRDLPVLVPPFSLPLLLPLNILPPEPARLSWAVGQMLAVVVSLMLCAVHFAIPERKLLFLTTAVALCGPFWESMRCAQVAPFLLLSLCLTLTYLQQNKEIHAGIACSAFLFKPHECFHFVLSQLASFKWRYVLVLGLVFAVAALVSVAAIGVDGWTAWRHLMSALLTDPQGTGPQLNPTIRGQLLRLGMGLSPGTVLMVSFGCWILFSVASLFLGFKFKSSKRMLDISIALTIPFSLLTSFHSHNYDLMLLIPGALALYSFGAATLSSARSRLILKIFIAVLILPLMLPFYIIIHYGLLVHGFVPNPFFFSLVLFLLTGIYLTFRLIVHGEAPAPLPATPLPDDSAA
jgi:hypothetical protein